MTSQCATSGDKAQDPRAPCGLPRLLSSGASSPGRGTSWSEDVCTAGPWPFLRSRPRQRRGILILTQVPSRNILMGRFFDRRSCLDVPHSAVKFRSASRVTSSCLSSCTSNSQEQPGHHAANHACKAALLRRELDVHVHNQGWRDFRENEKITCYILCLLAIRLTLWERFIFVDYQQVPAGFSEVAQSYKRAGVEPNPVYQVCMGQPPTALAPGSRPQLCGVSGDLFKIHLTSLAPIPQAYPLHGACNV